MCLCAISSTCSEMELSQDVSKVNHDWQLRINSAAQVVLAIVFTGYIWGGWMNSSVTTGLSALIDRLPPSVASTIFPVVLGGGMIGSMVGTYKVCSLALGCLFGISNSSSSP